MIDPLIAKVASTNRTSVHLQFAPSCSSRSSKMVNICRIYTKNFGQSTRKRLLELDIYSSSPSLGSTFASYFTAHHVYKAFPVHLLCVSRGFWGRGYFSHKSFRASALCPCSGRLSEMGSIGCAWQYMRTGYL